jgi:hypothetical protein
MRDAGNNLLSAAGAFRRQLLVQYSQWSARRRNAVNALWQNKATQIYAGLCVVLILSLVFVATTIIPHRQPQIPPIDILSRLKECRGEIHSGVAIDKVTPDVWDRISDICYNQVRGEAVLTDFSIRRSTLIEQQVEGRIILWMVVGITLSGVALACLQLVAADQLARTGHGDLSSPQEITLEQNKISLKSSVTGLMILVISFAFFMVYIVWVYTVKELKQDPPETTVTPKVTYAPPYAPPTGGYGPPPVASGKPDASAPTTLGMPKISPPTDK